MLSAMRFRGRSTPWTVTFTFCPTLTTSKSNFAFHVADNARVSASLEALHAALDETLGLTHE